MRKDKVVWTNKKFGKREFEGFHEFSSKKVRVFVLSPLDGKSQDKVFDSFQAAVALGWKRKVNG